VKIYEPQGRAREYSPLALNYLKGCDHACEYCYVKPMMKRFNSKYIHEEVSSNCNYKELELSAKKMQGCGKQILLSFTSDPYCSFENGQTKAVLEILNKYKHKVAILTKNPEKALKDIDVISKFGQRIKIGTTLTFSNEVDSLKWEPGAPSPDSRIKGLKGFYKKGIKTWASFEPVIDPKQSLICLEKISGFIDHVRIGKLNNYKGIDKQINWSNFLNDSVKMCRKNNIPFYIKKDLLDFNDRLILKNHEIDQDFLNL
jgi:DNA repair photolyase